jgi:hypothetical protein
MSLLTSSCKHECCRIGIPAKNARKRKKAAIESTPVTPNKKMVVQHVESSHGSSTSSFGLNRPVIAKNLFECDEESEDDVVISDPDDPLLLEIWNAMRKDGASSTISVSKPKETRPTVSPTVNPGQRSSLSPIFIPKQASKKTKFHFDSSDEDETPISLFVPPFKTNDRARLNKLHKSTHASLDLFRIGIKKKKVEADVEKEDAWSMELKCDEWPAELSPCLEDETCEVDEETVGVEDIKTEDVMKEAPVAKGEEFEITKAVPVMTESVQVEIKSSMLSFLSNCRVE